MTVIAHRIAVCNVEGDYIEWTKDRAPEAGDCPFDCDCVPVEFVRADADRGAVAPCLVCAQSLALTQLGEVECPNCHERLRAGWLAADAGGAVAR